MSSKRIQILTLLADRRIEVAQAERLLALLGGRDRFLSLALCAIVAAVGASSNFAPNHLGENLRAALRSAYQFMSGSPVFHHLPIFLYRLLGELP